MTDLSTHLMLDDVNLAILATQASSAFALAGYVNGDYANWNELVDKYEPTGKFLLSIDVLNQPSAGAQCLDIESGDATVADAPGWFEQTAAAGKLANDARYYPKLYTSAGEVQELINAMTQAGVSRDRYMVWSAHYTGVAHICSPSACGYPQADATQWTSEYEGLALDASLCYGYFFTVGAPPPPAFAAPSGLGISVKAATLTWSAVEGAEAYHVQVLGEGGKVLFDESPGTNSAIFSPLTPGGVYLARVAVHEDAAHQASPWSPEFKFTA